MDIHVIILQLKENNHSHFNEFYQMTSRQIFFTALAILKDQSLAEDIMQDTYVSFLENIHQYKDGHNIYAYLSIIARNLSINSYNKLKRVVQDEERIAMVSTTIKPCESSHIQDTLNLLDNDIEKEIITYHVLLEYTFLEISKIVQKPLGTVLWIYNKAIKKLKERLGEQR